MKPWIKRLWRGSLRLAKVVSARTRIERPTDRQRERCQKGERYSMIWTFHFQQNVVGLPYISTGGVKFPPPLFGDVLELKERFFSFQFPASSTTTIVADRSGRVLKLEKEIEIYRYACLCVCVCVTVWTAASRIKRASAFCKRNLRFVQKSYQLHHPIKNNEDYDDDV